MADVLKFDVAEIQRRRGKSKEAANGRKLIWRWRGLVTEKCRQGRLLHSDLGFADVLANFPSATMAGYIWASQGTLAAKLGRSGSTIARCVRRLKAAGLLDVQQRGNGRTAIYVFCVAGERLFPRKANITASSSMTGLAPSSVTRLEASALSSVTTKSCKSYESNKGESPPKPPTATAEQGEQQQWPREASGEAVHHGEILPPACEIEFTEFWSRIESKPGQIGPALAAWRKLSARDRAEIGGIVGRLPNHSGLVLGMWASTWLNERVWQKPGLITPEQRSARIFAEMLADAPKPKRWIDLAPYSDDWKAERARRLAAGESVLMMDRRARDGESWPVVAADD